MRVIAGVLTAGVILLIMLLLIFVPGVISIATAPFRGEVAKNEQVEASGSYRIAAYDEFYSMCSSIQTSNDNMKNLKNEMDNSTDEKRKAQLQSGITAQQNTKNELVNDYNSKAASEYTSGQFKDSDLPYRIDPNKEDVNCDSSE